MPDPKKQNITLDIKELYPQLCPKCQRALKKLLGEKLAEEVIKE
jgi:hypothetical protein